MFDGKLNKIPVELANVKSFIGMCAYRKKRDAMGRVVLYDFRLRINERMDFSQEELEDTIIHEMIHYYIGVNGIKDTSSHGQVFRQIMENINQRYGRNLTITHKSTDAQREQLSDKRVRWHVIAVVTFKDGRVGVKVLPKNKTRIKYYQSKASTAVDIESVRVFWSKNTFFNKYPCSSAMKCYIVTRETLEKEMVGAEEILL